MNINEATSAATFCLTHDALLFDTSEIIAEASKDPMAQTRWYHWSETRKIIWNETRNMLWDATWNPTYDATKSSVIYATLWEIDHQ